MTIRAAVAQDFAEFARLYPELGVQDPLPSPEQWWQIYGPETLLIEDDKGVLGYLYGQALGASGYVRHLVIDPRARGRGLGRALMQAIRERFVAQGCSDWRLNVKVDNRAAIELYRSCGMLVEYHAWVLRVVREAQPFSAIHPQRLTRVEVRAEEDARHEAQFQIQAGLLTRHRSRPNTRVYRFDAAGVPVALAPFDPFFPGCFPLRIPMVHDALEVVAGLLPLVPAEREYLQLVLERDQASAQALLETGAQLVFEIQHMSGPLKA